MKSRDAIKFLKKHDAAVAQERALRERGGVIVAVEVGLIPATKK